MTDHSPGEIPSAADIPPSIPGVEGLEQVGRGGFGVVYRGRQPDLEREVAVKVVLSAAQDADVERWRKEIAAMGRLSNHPNILGVYSGGLTDKGLPYLVMPFVPEGSLGDRIANEGPLGPAEVASMGAKLAGALAAAHAVGILHRDVKPDNVLISPYGEPQLTDFGIARLVGSTTTVGGSVHATVRYAAPEVLSGQPATEAADVYGLGATLFACLTGSAPFAQADENSIVALVGRIATEKPANLRRYGVPARLAQVIENALEKNPADRIGSADELRLALEDALRDRPSAGAETQPVAGEATRPMRTSARDATAAVPIVTDDFDPGQTQPSDAQPRSGALDVHDEPEPAVSRRSYGMLASLAVLVAGLAALLFVVTRDDNPGRDASLEAGTSTTEAADQDESASPSTTTSQRASTTDPPSSAAGPIGERVNDYFAAISSGDLKNSYLMLSPDFRRQQSRGGYEKFWNGQQPVRIVGEIRVDPEAKTAVVPLEMSSGREDYRMTFVQAEDGTWYIDGPRGG